MGNRVCRRAPRPRALRGPKPCPRQLCAVPAGRSFVSQTRPAACAAAAAAAAAGRADVYAAALTVWFVIHGFEPPDDGPAPGGGGGGIAVAAARLEMWKKVPAEVRSVGCYPAPPVFK